MREGSVMDRRRRCKQNHPPTRPTHDKLVLVMCHSPVYMEFDRAFHSI